MGSAKPQVSVPLLLQMWQDTGQEERAWHRMWVMLIPLLHPSRETHISSLLCSILTVSLCLGAWVTPSPSCWSCSSFHRLFELPGAKERMTWGLRGFLVWWDTLLPPPGLREAGGFPTALCPEHKVLGPTGLVTFP